MASVQYGKHGEIATQLTFEEKASLDEIVKHAELSFDQEKHAKHSFAGFGPTHSTAVARPCAGVPQAAGIMGWGVNCHPQNKHGNQVLENQFLVIGSLKNQAKGPLSVMDKKIYSGNIDKGFPNPLKQGISSFWMSAMTDGVKAGVVYSGKNKAGVECGWLLAFDNTEDTGMRIYAACGKKNKFAYNDWETVEMLLDRAGTVAKASDKETGTSFTAKIEGTAGKSIVGASVKG